MALVYGLWKNDNVASVTSMMCKNMCMASMCMCCFHACLLPDALPPNQS